MERRSCELEYCHVAFVKLCSKYGRSPNSSSFLKICHEFRTRRLCWLAVPLHWLCYFTFSATSISALSERWTYFFFLAQSPRVCALMAALFLQRHVLMFDGRVFFQTFVYFFILLCVLCAPASAGWVWELIKVFFSMSKIEVQSNKMNFGIKSLFAKASVSFSFIYYLSFSPLLVFAHFCLITRKSLVQFPVGRTFLLCAPVCHLSTLQVPTP